jgi:hypothetical protein
MWASFNVGNVNEQIDGWTICWQLGLNDGKLVSFYTEYGYAQCP